MSITPNAQPPGRPFNEQAALEELERLQRAIEDTRRRRKETGEAFDAFVRSFQKERLEAATLQIPRARERDEVASSIVESSRTEVSVPVVAPPGGAVPDTVVTPAIVKDPEAPSVGAASAPIPAPIAASPVARRRKPFSGKPFPGKPFPMIPAIGGAALAIVAAIVLIGRPWGTSPTESGVRSSGSDGSAAVTTTRTPNPGSRTPNPESRPAAPVAAAPQASPAPTTGVNAELTAVRRVWVRVITDGNRVERELPAGTRVPLHAERTLTLRIGDAGAVKVSVDNHDQGPLGRDGEVVMRTFTAQPPAR